MNSKYLGDALDHWKGSLIEYLSDEALVNNLVVEPMITDLMPWSTNDIETYRRLLRLKPSDQIYHDRSTFSGNRKEYFDELPDNTDLFIDPDTGIATGRALRKHIKVSELNSLLGNLNRVVMVYQHSAKSFFLERICEISEILSLNIRSVHCTVYESGQVAMFFMSRNKGRIQKIRDNLRVHLQGTAENRIL